MTRKLYAAYGSNMNISQMSDRCPTAKLRGNAVIKGYRLLFRGPHAGAVATIEPKRGGVVPVLLWELAPADERALDRYEGYPVLYTKEQLTVHQDNTQLEAMVYIMTPGRPLNQPSCYYYSVIREGYITAGLYKRVLRKATTDSKRSDIESNTRTGEVNASS